jgi:hypothetical protein
LDRFCVGAAAGTAAATGTAATGTGFVAIRRSSSLASSFSTIDVTTEWWERSHRMHYLGDNNNNSQHWRVRDNYVSLLVKLWLGSLLVLLETVVVVATSLKLLWKPLSNFFSCHINKPQDAMASIWSSINANKYIIIITITAFYGPAS